jgi:hypothetical protein
MARCNGCGCTDERACVGGCSWAYQSPNVNICSRCDGTASDLIGSLKAVEAMCKAHEKHDAFVSPSVHEIRAEARLARKRFDDRKAALRSPTAHKRYLAKRRRA